MENKEKLVRKIAYRVLKKYNLMPPVDVDVIINEKGIKYFEENLGSNADGYSDLCDSDLKIIVNSQIEYEPRRRFTIAHELGHVFISWHDDVTLCMTDNEYVEHNMLDIQEREANVFASELLMPTNWVKDILEEVGQDRMEEAVEILSERANTSIMASFYALENAMEAGHAFFVNGSSPFTKRFITGDSQGFCFWGYNMQDTYEYVAAKKEYFSVGYYKVAHYILPSCPANEIIINAAMRCEAIIDVFYNLFNEDYFAWMVWARRVLRMLPQTYVGFLYQGEKILQHYRNDKSEIVLEFGEKTRLIECCNIFNYTYEVVSFDNEMSMVFVEEPTYTLPIKRKYFCDSKSMIKIILNEVYYDRNEISKASYRINGIIGSALSHRNGMTKEQIYILLQKKLRRKDLKDFVEDSRFDEFVLIKALEKGHY